MVNCLLIEHHNAFFPCLLEKISAFEKELRKINILFEAIRFTKKKKKKAIRVRETMEFHDIY